MPRRIGSTLVKLFDYEELTNAYMNISKMLTISIYAVIITGAPLIDYTSMSQLGLLTFRLTIAGIMLSVSMLIARDLTKIAPRMERRKKELLDTRSFYLVLTLLLLTAIFYFISIYS